MSEPRRTANEGGFGPKRVSSSEFRSPATEESAPPLRILNVARSADDLPLIELVLRQSFPSIAIRTVTGAEELARSLVRADFEVVLCDRHLGWADGLELLASFRARRPGVRVLVFAPENDAETVVECLQRGADDYLTRTPAHYTELPNRLLRLFDSAGEEEAPGDRGERMEDLRALLDTGRIGFFRCDWNGHVVQSNRAFGELLGIAEEQLDRAANIYEFGARPGDIADLFDRLRQYGRVHESRVELRRADGATVRAALTATLLSASGGEQFVTGVLVDETERDRLERARDERLARLERRNADLDHFVSMAAHELREPIRAVSRFAGLLEKQTAGLLDDTAAQSLRNVKQANERMGALVGDLLEYSRLTSRARPLERVELEAVLRQALVALGAMMAESSARVEHGPLPVVQADAGQMASLFQNLIGNAIKFRGDQAPEIQVAARETETGWIVTVQDNGIGIAPEFAEEIFAPFRRLHTEDEYPGTGLGLALCRRIVERHGGRLWVDSQPGRGSTFFFSLPAKPQQETPS